MNTRGLNVIQTHVARLKCEKRERLENLKETGKGHFFKGLHIELDEDCPTHIPVKKKIAIVFAASKRAGMDSYSVLRAFEFTEEEIKDYFEKTRVERAEI